MVDTDVVGCCWIELPKGKYGVREEKDTSATDSQNLGKVGKLPSSGSSIVVFFFFQNFYRFECNSKTFSFPLGVLVSV